MHEKTGLLIPCRNVAANISGLLDSLDPALLEDITEILCIDNHSADATAQTLLDKQSKRSAAYSGKLTVIENSRDYNYGGSLKIGFRYFVENDFDWVIVLHSDDQGDSNTILQNFKRARAEHPDSAMIIASRFEAQSDVSGYSTSRVLGNLFFNLLTRLTTGLRISDGGAAVAMTRISVLKRIPFFQITSGLHFHPQLNILIYSLPDVKIREIPLRWKDSNVGSSVRVVRYSWTLILMLVGFVFRKLAGKEGAHLFCPNDPAFDPVFEISRSPVDAQKN
jgi:glycosyltransferase involved in cell wall biosynthesis